jgi:hypothetical protein
MDFVCKLNVLLWTIALFVGVISYVLESQRTKKKKQLIFCKEEDQEK